MANEVFSKRLKELRKNRNMTQKDLANELGVSMGSIGFYENQERTPDIDFLNSVADFFDVSTEYLLGRTDVKSMDLEIKEISNKTGLSEQSIENIIKIKSSPRNSVFFDDEVLCEYSRIDILNYLFIDRFFIMLLDDMCKLIHASKIKKELYEDYNSYLKEWERKSIDYLFLHNNFKNTNEILNSYDLSELRCDRSFNNCLMSLKLSLNADYEKIEDPFFKLIALMGDEKNKRRDHRKKLDGVISKKAGDPDGNDQKEE